MKKPIFLSTSKRNEIPPLNPRILILATQTLNQASAMAMMVDGYAALEKLITHTPCEIVNGRSRVREDVSALMRAMNVEMGRQVDSLVRQTAILHQMAAGDSGP